MQGKLPHLSGMSIVDPEKRRALMARFRSKDTKPEMVVRRALHAAGRRFRLHVKDLPGRPDIVLPRDRTVILIHGCFWHAHAGCSTARVPLSKPEFWQAKFAATKERDQRNAEALLTLGWRVIVIWECEALSASLPKLLASYRLI
jgi:DNA mismatch endonuclease (patch repair protein)